MSADAKDDNAFRLVQLFEKCDHFPGTMNIYFAMTNYSVILGFVTAETIGEVLCGVMSIALRARHDTVHHVTE